MEGSFLCPILQNTDEFGQLLLPTEKANPQSQPSNHKESEEMEEETSEELELDDRGNVKQDADRILEPSNVDSELDQDDQQERKEKLVSNQR